MQNRTPRADTLLPLRLAVLGLLVPWAVVLFQILVFPKHTGSGSTIEWTIWILSDRVNSGLGGVGFWFLSLVLGLSSLAVGVVRLFKRRTSLPLTLSGLALAAFVSVLCLSQVFDIASMIRTSLLS